MSHPDPFDPAPRGRWTVGSSARALTAGVSLLSLASPLVAQAPAPTPPPSSSAVVRSLTFEYILVVAMVGAALFAVCRSSRRN